MGIVYDKKVYGESSFVNKQLIWKECMLEEGKV